MDERDNGVRIGVMGSTQIQHLIPVIAQEYKVYNIQERWDSARTRFGRALAFVHGLRHCDVVYCVFCPPQVWKYAKVAHAFKKKFMGHWIGSDVRLLGEGVTSAEKVKQIDYNFVCFRPLQKVLQSKGLTSTILPITPFKTMKFDLDEMPAEHGVLVYMPDGKEEYYGLSTMLPVMERYQDVPFYVVANHNKDQFNGLPNVHVLGTLGPDEMNELYKKISILLRVHVSDGLSMMVLEALGKGKKVIWDQEFDRCYPGATTEQMMDSMSKILEASPTPDVEAHEFVVETFTPEKYLEIFRCGIESVTKVGLGSSLSD